MTETAKTQKSGKIAFQGHAGAYSDLACQQARPDWETLPCPSFEDAFHAVINKQADLAMIPIDNTLAGRVADVHHLLPESGLFIIGEHFQPIKHALLGIEGAKIDDITDIHSHVHAIPQCRKLIREKGLTAHVAADTAGGAKLVAARGDKHHAAIASSLAADIYGLSILIEDIQDASHNTTRFLILSRENTIPPPKKEANILTSLVYRVRHIPAALYKTLGGFASNGISMAKLESYVGEGFQVAQFYAEVEAHPDSDAFRLALEELEFYASEVKLLGSYEMHPFRKHSL